jgi:hypothetical protein
MVDRGLGNHVSPSLILTGAGASVDAGIPTAYELTERIDNSLPRFAGMQSRNVFRYVVGGLMMAKGLADESPFDGVNVEEVFSAVELLAKRGSLEAAPFIGAWHPGVEALDRVGARYDRLARAIVEQVAEAFGRGRVSFASHDFRKEFESAVRETISPGTGQVYADAAKQMVRSLGDLIRVGSSALVAYLNPLVAYAHKEGAVIATLNYDTSVEAAADVMGIPCGTGITEWARGDGLQWPGEVVPLLKLHGSIGWEYAQVQLDTGGSEYRFRECHWSETAKVEPILMFGQRDKLKVEGPFLDLLMEFRQALSAATSLLVIGYSFRDPHINHYIDQWLDRGARKHIVVLDPEFPATDSRFARRLHSLGSRWITRIERTTAEGLAEALAALGDSVSSIREDPVREPGYHVSDALLTMQKAAEAKTTLQDGQGQGNGVAPT